MCGRLCTTLSSRDHACLLSRELVFLTRCATNSKNWRPITNSRSNIVTTTSAPSAELLRQRHTAPFGVITSKEAIDTMDGFDFLRREATKLERHLEDRVAQYQQLAQRFSANPNTEDEQTISLLNSAKGDLRTTIASEKENSLRNDISRTLSSLSDLINHKLSPASEQSGKSQHAMLVKRYREILFDLSGDFQKASATLSRKREQAELFRCANTPIASNGGEDGQDPAMEALLRERCHINNSLNSATDVISQASDIYGDLRTQGASLRRVGGTISKMTHNVPGLNRLVDNIRHKRTKDDMVVAGAVAACILFILWYVSR